MSSNADTFSLTLLTPDGLQDIPFNDGTAIVCEMRTQDSESQARFALDTYGGSDEPVLWGKMDEELKEFSKRHPDVLFRMNVQNTEYGTCENVYFLKGKRQQCVGEIVYEPYDPEALA